MLALCLDDTVTLRQVDAPDLPQGHARIAMRLAGICGTDLEITRGYRAYRGILGHEFVGEVLECPDAPQWEGRRVTGEINLSCGHCERCTTGLAKHCAARRVMGIAGHPGCFAEQLVLPVGNLHAVPEGVCDEQAVFTEPLAAALEIFEGEVVTPDDRVAVIGDGKLGLLIVLALRSRGIAPTLIGRHPERLARIGAPQVVAASADMPGEQGFDVVVEATGSPEGLRSALAHTRPRGTVVLESTVHGATSLDTTALVVDEIRLIGSRCGPFDQALAALADGRIDPRPLVDARYPLVQGEAAFAHARRRGTLKVLLQGPAYG